LDGFQIIDEKDIGLNQADYVLGGFSLAGCWMALRVHNHLAWNSVIYEETKNSAVAAAEATANLAYVRDFQDWLIKSNPGADHCYAAIMIMIMNEVPSMAPSELLEALRSEKLSSEVSSFGASPTEAPPSEASPPEIPPTETSEQESHGRDEQLLGSEPDTFAVDFLLHTFWDLHEFITDFRKSSNGKPTKALQRKLGE
jgi:hypothetical protein